MSPLNLISLGGLPALAILAWAAGGFRRPVAWRTVFGSGTLLLALGALVFLFSPTRRALVAINDLIVALLGASRSGAEFLFGPLALNPGESTAAGEPSVGFVLATQVLPAVIFFAALMAALYHLGILQPVVRLCARLFRRTLRLSGAEALSGAANIFFGVESAAAIRPYLAGMTRSELLTVLTCGMSTVASTTLSLYVFFLEGTFPRIAGHLVSASILSIPAAVLTSKLMLPETGRPQTFGTLPPMAASERHGNTMAALAAGSWDGLKLAAGIATLLIAVLGVVGIADLLLGRLGGLLGLGAAAGTAGAPPAGALEGILGWLFTPLAWLLGIAPHDLPAAARLLGERVIVTETVAYRDLGRLAAQGALTPRTLLVLSYALCGFTHVASVGIFVGGTAALAPSRRDDLAALGLRALVASTLATLMTGATAGLLYHGQPGVLGLLPPLPHRARCGMIAPMRPATRSFADALARRGLGPLGRGPVTTLQVNVGKVCNQACHHCHVDAGPRRTETMSARTAQRVLDLLAASPGVEVLDITGGAPELAAVFRPLVDGARRLGRGVIDRCNLTILLVPGQEDLGEFLAERAVRIVASLPCYLKENVERQRGTGVFDRSLEALRRLNALGYGRPGSPLVLDLVYNPVGPSLPPSQESLEADYRRILLERDGVTFHNLLTLTNMPINRFASDLDRTGRRGAYMDLLEGAFNPATVPHLMCRSLVSVGWDGRLYDCDFNQMLEMDLGGRTGGVRPTVWDVDRLDALDGAPIAIGAHCFGCTAGAGSGCSGALA